MNEGVLSIKENHEDSVSDGIFKKYREDSTDLLKTSSDEEDNEDSVSNGLFNKYGKDFTDLSKMSGKQHSNNTTIVFSNKRRDPAFNKMWTCL